MLRASDQHTFMSLLSSTQFIQLIPDVQLYFHFNINQTILVELSI